MFDSGTDSSSPTFSSTGEDIEEMMTPTRPRTTDDLFAAIHRYLHSYIVFIKLKKHTHLDFWFCLKDYPVRTIKKKLRFPSLQYIYSRCACIKIVEYVPFLKCFFCSGSQVFMAKGIICKGIILGTDNGTPS